MADIYPMLCFEIVQMPPLEYIELVIQKAPYYGSSVQGARQQLDENMIEEYRKDMLHGSQFSMPTLDISRGTMSRLGRHRAFAAYDAGMKSISILKVWRCTEDDVPILIK